ncbi:unnamed protein product [Arctogadus glacialis]
MEICGGEKEQHEPPLRRPLCEADVTARPDVTARLADSGPRPVERMMTSRSGPGDLETGAVQETPSRSSTFSAVQRYSRCSLSRERGGEGDRRPPDVSLTALVDHWEEEFNSGPW